MKNEQEVDMATSSFGRPFVVTDSKAIKRLNLGLANTIKLTYVKRDLKKDSEEGIASLKRLLSRLEKNLNDGGEDERYHID